MTIERGYIFIVIKESLMSRKRPRTTSKCVYKQGDLVYILFHGGSTWYAGNIFDVNEKDQTYNVKCQDGTMESNVSPKNIRHIRTPTNNEQGDTDKDLPVGCKIEYLFYIKQSSKFFSGTVKKKVGESWYLVHFDDGDKLKVHLLPENQYTSINKKGIWKYISFEKKHPTLNTPHMQPVLKKATTTGYAVSAEKAATKVLEHRKKIPKKRNIHNLSIDTTLEQIISWKSCKDISDNEYLIKMQLYFDLTDDNPNKSDVNFYKDFLLKPLDQITLYNRLS